jgi:transcriptional regulator GlxA family with amidase domain
VSFGILIYPGVEELDFQGPWEIVGLWRKYAEGPAPVLIARDLVPVTCAHGMRVLPDVDLAGAPRLDALLVPGGFAAFEAMKDPELIAYVRGLADAGTTLMSVCSGTFVLLAAGVLAGRVASTNWKVVKMLRDAGVQVREERWTHDGPVWTSAGVSAGIDMMLAYIAERCGEATASTVQLHAEYFPDPRVYGEARDAAEVSAYIRALP